MGILDTQIKQRTLAELQEILKTVSLRLQVNHQWLLPRTALEQALKALCLYFAPAREESADVIQNTLAGAIALVDNQGEYVFDIARIGTYLDRAVPAYEHHIGLGPSGYMMQLDFRQENFHWISLANTSFWQEWLPSIPSFRPRELLVLALRSGQRVYGVVYLVSNQSGFFDKSAGPNLAECMPLVTEIYLLSHQTHQEQMLRVLTQITDSLRYRSKIERTLDGCLRVLVPYFQQEPYESEFRMYFYWDDRLIGSHGTTGHLGVSQPIGLYQHLQHNPTILIIDNAARLEYEAFVTPEMGSAIAMPIFSWRYQDKLTGALIVIAGKIGTFNRDDRAFMQQVANQLASVQEYNIIQRQRQVAAITVGSYSYMTKAAEAITHQVAGKLTTLINHRDLIAMKVSKLPSAIADGFSTVLNTMATSLETLGNELEYYRELFGDPKRSNKDEDIQEQVLLDMLQIAWKEAQSELQRHNATLDLKIDCPPPLRIKVSYRFISSLREIIINAGKYAKVTAQPVKVPSVNPSRNPPKSGHLKISAIQHNREVEIRFQDDGIGIARDQLDRVFEGGERGEKARLQSDGSGMGLAAARLFIEILDGRITVKSQGEGYGSTFIIVMPVADVTQPL
jgi:signal transduction histidine kinase